MKAAAAVLLLAFGGLLWGPPLGAHGAGATRHGGPQQAPSDPIRAAVARRDFDAALATAQRVAGEDPAAAWRALRADAAAWMPRAGAWLRQGRAEDAVWVFRTLADGSPGPGWTPGAAWALSNLALTQRHLGRLAEAEATYELALAADPLDQLLWNDWGLFLRGQGRLAEAREAFLQSTRVDPDPAVGPALTNLVHMARMHPEELAEPPAELWREGLSRRPDGLMLRRVSLDLLAR